MQSSMHPYINRAKERLDEMDAALASLEARLDNVQADLRAGAGRMLAELREKREHFQDVISKQANAGETAWDSARAELEAGWNGFEAQLRQYIESFAGQVEQQNETFRLQADAQLKSWRAAAERFNNDAREFEAEYRRQVELAVRRMNEDAAQAEEKLRKMSRAGNQSWSAMMAALTETRTAFDRASQAAAEAFRQAAR